MMKLFVLCALFAVALGKGYPKSDSKKQTTSYKEDVEVIKGASVKTGAGGQHASKLTFGSSASGAFNRQHVGQLSRFGGGSYYNNNYGYNNQYYDGYVDPYYSQYNGRLNPYYDPYSGHFNSYNRFSSFPFHQSLNYDYHNLPYGPYSQRYAGPYDYGYDFNYGYPFDFGFSHNNGYIH